MVRYPWVWMDPSEPVVLRCCEAVLKLENMPGEITLIEVLKH